MKLIIIFFGLIVHVNQPWSFDNTAALPESEHHTAEMWIPKEAVVDPDAPWIRDFCQTDPCVVPLKKVKVEVTGTKGTFSSMSDKLIASLPALRTIAPRCRALSDSVRTRTLNPKDITSFIDYRGGSRWVDKHYPEKASIPDSPWNQPRCLACKVRYEAELEGDTATFVFTDTKLDPDGVFHVQLRPGFQVQVRHLPSPYTAPHFDLHYRVFEKPCIGPIAMPHDDLECKGPTCTDSDYSFPMPFPQADCTNTGYP